MQVLPKTVAQWERYATSAGVDKVSIHNRVLWDSASKIGDQQFLVLRAIWPEIKNKKSGLLRSGNLVSPQIIKDAAELLLKVDGWLKYLDLLGQKVDSLLSSGFKGLGAFTLVLKNQLVIEDIDVNNASFTWKIDYTPILKRLRPLQHRTHPQDSPTELTKRFQGLHLTTPKTSLVDEFDEFDTEVKDEIVVSSPEWSEGVNSARAIDEQIVNAALYLFLDAITLHQPNLKVEWSLYRQPFILTDKDGNKVFEARVDGVLKIHGGGKEVLAIIEVKPFRRINSKPARLGKMQETAQMAAWINNYPDLNYEEKRGKKPKTM